MYVSIRRYADIEDTRSLVRDIQMHFVPRLQKMPGFVAYYAIETNGGGVTTVSVFSSARLAEESNENARRWLEDRDGKKLEPAETMAGQVAVAVPPIRG
jgi:hypothetical protein